jgi:lamin tail-like protein
MRERLGSSLAAAAVLVVLLPGAAAAQIPIYENVFADGFESGDFSAWSSVLDDGGDLAVTQAAALAGTYGLQATVNDTHGLYVQDDSPQGEHYFDGQFSFQPNGFDPGEAQNHRRVRLFVVFESPSRRLLAFVLRRLNGQYALAARVRQDDGSQVDTPFVDVGDTAHTVYFQWYRSSGPSANDGSFRMRIDGVEVAILSGLDNSISVVDYTRLGAISVKAGAGGVLRLDTLFAWRDLAPAHGQLVINEVDYDQPGFSGDQGEFIEVYNPGPAPTPLAGLTLVQFDGTATPATSYQTMALDLNGSTLAPGQYWVVANPGLPVAPGALVTRYILPIENIRDGGSPGNFHADGLLLVYAATCHHIDALSYEGNIFQATGPCGVTPLKEGSTNLFAEDGPLQAGSLIRYPNGADTDDAGVDWQFTTTPSPGAANVKTP